MMMLYPLALGESTYRMSKKLAERSRQFEMVSQMDGLTHLFNRRYWESLLIEEFALRHQLQDPGCKGAFLLLLDLDHFKHINDTHGHLVGDEVLRNFSRLLRTRLREDDLIGRYGGEEFVVDEARESVAGENNLWGCTVSAGLVPFTPDMEAHFVWLQRADHAMYCAKENGRDRLVLWEATLVRQPRDATDATTMDAKQADVFGAATRPL